MWSSKVEVKGVGRTSLPGFDPLLTIDLTPNYVLFLDSYYYQLVAY